MLFCLGEGRAESEGEGYQKNNRIFNVEVSHDEWEKARDSLPEIELPITKWVEEDDMTKDDKENYSNYKQLGGCLKTFSYEDAWQEVWKNLKQSDKQKFLDLPHFNAKIFKEITGIEVEKENTKKMVKIKIKDGQILEGELVK